MEYKRGLDILVITFETGNLSKILINQQFSYLSLAIKIVVS